MLYVWEYICIRFGSYCRLILRWWCFHWCRSWVDLDWLYNVPAILMFFWRWKFECATLHLRIEIEGYSNENSTICMMYFLLEMVDFLCYVSLLEVRSFQIWKPLRSASGKRLEPPNGKSSGPEKPERTVFFFFEKFGKTLMGLSW